MWIWSELTEEALVEVQITRSCRCGHMLHADVASVGRGQSYVDLGSDVGLIRTLADPGYVADRGAAEEANAIRRAEQAGHGQARLHLGLTPCPRCGRRSKISRLKSAGPAGVIAAAVGTALALLLIDSVLGSSQEPRPFVAVAAVLTGLLIGAMGAWISLRRAVLQAEVAVILKSRSSRQPLELRTSDGNGWERPNVLGRFPCAEGRSPRRWRPRTSSGGRRNGHFNRSGGHLSSSPWPPVLLLV